MFLLKIFFVYVCGGVHMQLWVCVCVQVCIRSYGYVFVCRYAHTAVGMCLCAGVHMQLWVHICVRVHYISVWRKGVNLTCWFSGTNHFIFWVSISPWHLELTNLATMRSSKLQGSICLHPQCGYFMHTMSDMSSRGCQGLNSFPRAWTAHFLLIFFPRPITGIFWWILYAYCNIVPEVALYPNKPIQPLSVTHTANIPCRIKLCQVHSQAIVLR